MTKKTMIALIALALAGGGAYLLLAGHEHHDEGDGHAHGKQPATTQSHAEDNGHDHGEEKDAHAHGEEGHTEEGTTTITEEAAKLAGLVIDKAGPVNLGERVPLRGQIILNPETSAAVKARFPGVVKSVRKTIGDAVKKGETLATVESNDSLQTYAVISPLAGVVLARNANVGDTAADQPMFTVANLATVTAELHVFQQDLSRIQVGQQVVVTSMDGAIEGNGTVKGLLPTTDADTQTVQAWVTLDNADSRWRAGMAVQGGAVVGKDEVALAVKTSAIQTMEDKPVVFVKEGETYTSHPVKLGRTDGVFIEVLEGLKPGSSYVAKNSFIVKADIGKAGAAHEH